MNQCEPELVLQTVLVSRMAATTVAAMASGTRVANISVPSKPRAKSQELSSKNLRVVSTPVEEIKSLLAVLSAPTKVQANKFCLLAEVMRHYMDTQHSIEIHKRIF